MAFVVAMGVWTRTLAVVCPTLAVLWACSSDEGTNTSPGAGGAGKGGSSGNSGSTSGGSTSKGGSGGSGGKGGMTGMAGATEGGSGGDGGSGGEAPLAGPECTACTTTSCEQEQAACEDSTACSAWLTCVNACADAACVRDCDADNGNAALLIAAMYECACDMCATDCAAAEACDQSCVDDTEFPNSGGIVGSPPANLAESGLYVQTQNGGWELAPYVREFQPEYKLWTAAETGVLDKRRWIYLPKCEQIDTDNMDHWSFPVGTRVWKEFKLGDVLIETRLMWHYGDTPDDWVMVSYQWPVDDQTDVATRPDLALLAADVGVPDANGTTHNIPSRAECQNCHGKLSERVLGFSAIQLSHNLAGVKLADLIDWGVMTTPPPAICAGNGFAGYDPPGTEIEQAALGYLHANCGNCHNDTGVDTSNSPDQPLSMKLRLLVGDTTVAATGAATTAFDVPTTNGSFGGNFRIDQTTPLNSVILTRIDSETAGTRMPPMREIRDDSGYDTVFTWIDGLQ